MRKIVVSYADCAIIYNKRILSHERPIDRQALLLTADWVKIIVGNIDPLKVNRWRHLILNMRVLRLVRLAPRQQTINEIKCNSSKINYTLIFYGEID